MFSISLSSCGNKIKSKESVTVKDSASYSDYKLNETHLVSPLEFSEDGITVKLDEILYEDVLTKLSFSLKNDKDVPVKILATDLAVNGLMSPDAMITDLAEKSDGNAVLSMSNEWLKESNIEAIADLEFIIRVLDERSDEIMKSEILKPTIDAPKNHSQKYDKEGVIIYKKDGVVFLAKELKKSKYANDRELSFYVENNTNTAFSIMAEDVYVNGKPIEPSFVISVNEGKKAIDSMLFLEKDLADNNITEITSIKASFKGINTDFLTFFEVKDVEIPVK